MVHVLYGIGVVRRILYIFHATHIARWDMDIL